MMVADLGKGPSALEKRLGGALKKHRHGIKDLLLM